ncbi:DNA invertase-like protein [Shigella sonnei]|nr:DNA invertase-like protein [Shigella sonnei]
MLFKNLHREFIFSLDGAATEHDTLLPRFTDDISRQSWVSEKVFCNPPFDLSSAMGEAMLGIMSTLAQLERSLIAERRKAGIERAKAEGVHMGRPVKASSEAVQTLISQGKTRLQIQEELGISRATYYRLAK